jgi:imidazolonepropionase
MWSVVGSLSPSLTWSYPNASCNPQGYAIDLRTGPLFTDHLGGGTGNPSTSWGPGSPLQPGKEYEWLVQAINGTTMGPPAGYDYFFTGPMCDTAALVAATPLQPANGAIVNNLDPSLIWLYPDACLPQGYRVDLSTDPSFADTSLSGGTGYRAGGIRSTVAATRAASDDLLYANLRALASEMLRQGTTTFECKSGYGLTVADEERSVRLAARVTPEVSYLGAHVLPPEFAHDPAGYLDLACGPMLDACAPHARWVDVFCERGAFGADEAAAVLAAGKAAGLIPRVHANQLGPGPGVRVAVEAGAASADHCTYLSAGDVDALASGETVATLLPGVEFSTRQPYPDARRLLDAGVTVALATDCNPGSCFTSSMAFCVALAVREMRMTTQEALWSATAGGARALRRTDVGHLGVGARADLLLLDAPSHAYLAYRPGVQLTAGVWQAGERVQA